MYVILVFAHEILSVHVAQADDIIKNMYIKLIYYTIKDPKPNFLFFLYPYFLIHSMQLKYNNIAYKKYYKNSMTKFNYKRFIHFKYETIWMWKTSNIHRVNNKNLK